MPWVRSMKQAIRADFMDRTHGIFCLWPSTSKSFAFSETFYGKQLLSLQSFFERKKFTTKVSPPLTHGLMY